MEKEQTLVLIKPDGVKRGLIGEIISRLEKAGLKIIGCKMVRADQKLAEEHYAEIQSQEYFPRVVNFIISGPILATVIEGDNVIKKVRQMVGDTYPAKALPGTIRGDFAHMTKERGNQKKFSVNNVIHASDEKLGNAAKEINLWFKPEELYDYKRCDEEFTM